MKLVIRRGTVEGRVKAPPSKSYTHRALFLSALADGRSRIISPLHSDDTDATRGLLGELGVSIEQKGDYWDVQGGHLQPPISPLNCGGSATTLRLGSALCSLLDGESLLTGNPSLLQRPVGALVDGLRQMGAECSDAGGFPPVRVRGGKLRGGGIQMRGDISSQFISAILLIAPLSEREVILTLTTPLESRPYVSMTMEAQWRFGVQVQASEDMRLFKVERQNYRPADFMVEGDWSSAAYPLAAGAIAGKVRVENLVPGSLQADASILGFLRGMGASVRALEGAAEAEASRLKGFEADVSDCPDLFPILAVLGASAEGRSIIRGVRRLAYKESNRVEAMLEGLNLMGIDAKRMDGEVAIMGGSPKGGVIDPKGDHRIAMAFSILGLRAEKETCILGAECVSKSYPQFWETMERLGMRMREA
ncbi:MAG: 3-phosphoshikimate 1-carboxyvinyltransferase [Candidatus Bathyarchaeia archaeon]